MKKIVITTLICLFLSSALAFAGGDQNMNRHDGELGQGEVNQVRNN